jgi:ATP-dependent exoDNAse (exonuclease V) beta subunit
MRRAALASAHGDLRREVPVQLRLENGTLAEGVVDLAFREKTVEGDREGNPVWTVVDFKTDKEMEAGRDHYEAQVRLYAQAVERATEEVPETVLLLV